jgi:hypothetical protein
MLKKLTGSKKDLKISLVERTAMSTIVIKCGAPCFVESESKYSFDVCDPTQL